MAFTDLQFVHNLEDIEFQIIGSIICPQNRVVGSLLAKLNLPEPFVCITRRFLNCLCEQIRIHEVGTGAGHQETAILYQTHTAQIDLTIACYSFF